MFRSFGTGVILAIFAVAALAPLLANGRPLYLRNAATGEVAFPFLRAFFSPDSTEPVIEKIFNFSLLFSPPAAMLCIILRRKKLWLKAAILVPLAILLAAPFFAVAPRADKTDYRALVSTLPPGSSAIFAPVPYSPEELAAKPYLPPGREHWLGTDHVGRSVFARMVYGARISLAVGFGAALIAIFIGTAVGTMCGFFGGAFDLLTMRFAEMVACFPTFLLLLILMALFQNWKFQQSIPAVIAVIGLTGWIGVCQLVRGEVLKIRKLPYVESCFAAGIGNFRIMFVHILPNIAETVAVCFTFGVAGAIMAESTLSFLGFGVQPPTASWGGLLRQAYSNPFAYWHLTLIPGLAIFITISAFNFVSVSRRID